MISKSDILKVMYKNDIQKWHKKLRTKKSMYKNDVKRGRTLAAFKSDIQNGHTQVKFKSELLINKIIKMLGLKLSIFFAGNLRWRDTQGSQGTGFLKKDHL